MKEFLNRVLLNMNDAKGEILLVLDNMVLQLKEMNNMLMTIKETVAPDPQPSCHLPMGPMLINIYISNST